MVLSCHQCSRCLCLSSQPSLASILSLMTWSLHGQSKYLCSRQNKGGRAKGACQLNLPLFKEISWKTQNFAMWPPLIYKGGQQMFFTQAHYHSQWNQVSVSKKKGDQLLGRYLAVSARTSITSTIPGNGFCKSAGRQFVYSTNIYYDQGMVLEFVLFNHLDTKLG